MFASLIKKQSFERYYNDDVILIILLFVFIVTLCFYLKGKIGEISMNMKALIPIADGSEEIESVTVIDILRRAGVDVTVAVIGSKDNDQITAARGTKVVGDCGITDCTKETWDAIVIPGGIEGASAIANCKIFHKILVEHASSKKLIGAICAAPALVLGGKGLLDEHIATCHPHFHNSINCRELDSESKVVIDDCYVTSQGPGTAIDFSLELVELLCGEVKREEVSSPLVLTTSPTSYY